MAISIYLFFCSSLPLEETYTDREFLSAIIAASEDMWELKCDPYLFFNRRVGNMYTSSLYAQLVAFFHKQVIRDFYLNFKNSFRNYSAGKIKRTRGTPLICLRK